MTTEPQMRAEIVAQVAAMENPAPQEPAPVEVAPAEVASEPAQEVDETTSGDAAEGVVIEDNPESQTQDVDGTEGQAEGEEGQDQAPAVEAPEFWPDEAKTDFAGLSAEAQTALVKHYKTAQSQINAKFEEAAAVRKAADTEKEALSQINAKISEALDGASATFRDKWDGMTDSIWLQLSRENPQEYVKLRAQYDAEQNALQQANAAKEAAGRVERQNWLKTQAEELKTFAPDLADPAKGKERFQKTLAYLQERGAKEQDLSDVSAAVMALAYDSMQLHELRKNKPTPVPKPAPRPGVAPAASAQAAPPKHQEAQALQNRFNQTKDRGDAVALLMAKGIL